MKSKTTPKSGLTYTPNSNLPTLAKYNTTWDLSRQYYQSEKDPQLEADITYSIAAYEKFAKRWRNKPFTTDATTLAVALREYETLSGDPRLSRPGRYFSLRSELDANDSTAEKAVAILRKRLRPASDKILFFGLELGKVSTETKKAFLKHPELEHFRYFLSQLFEGAKHDLTESEEKIIRLKAPQASHLWQEMTEKLISTNSVTWKGKKLALPEALETIDTLPSAEKPKLWKIIIEKIDSFGIPAEQEFNAIISDARSEDELRGYKKPYSATALAYQHDEASIEALVSTVSKEGFKLSRKFYKLKAKYHGVPALAYAQKYDTIGKGPLISFSEALTVCRDVFYQVNTEYGRIFDSMLENGQIDVYPKPGKRGGAFMSSQTGHPVNVMLNYKDTLKALETLAHEMGHAVHAHRSALNTPFYDGHSIVTAETASTLFEGLVYDAIIEAANEDIKIVLLHDKITRDIATIERQIAFFNCELEIHNTIHEHGAMTHDELKDCMYRHLRSYLGDSVDVEPADGASYVYIPHLRYGFYVYSYTFGHLMSSIMASRYKENNDYRKEIDIFLTAGASDTVVNIFRKIGIDTKKPETFAMALAAHAKDIETFGKLVNKKAR